MGLIEVFKGVSDGGFKPFLKVFFMGGFQAGVFTGELFRREGVSRAFQGFFF